MAHKSYIVGSGVPSLDDVIDKIVTKRIDIVLDATVVNRIKKESPLPKNFEPETFEVREDASGQSACASLDEAQTRAAVFFKLVNLANGKSSCRVGVLETLVSFLNSGIVPRLPATDTDSSALTVLADAMHGFGHTCSPSMNKPASRNTKEDDDIRIVDENRSNTIAGYNDNSNLSEALDHAGISVPGLSSAERASIVDGQAISAGTGAICVEYGRKMITMATCIAALTAEALRADIKAFDPDVVDALPHKGAADIGATVRAILEGSNMVNAKKGGYGPMSALNDVCVVHAAAQQDVSGAAAPVKAVLGSSALPPAKDGSLQQASSPALQSSLMALAASLLRCTALSLKRTGAVIENVGNVEGIKSLRKAAGQPLDEDKLISSAELLQTALQSISSGPCLSFEAAQQQISAALEKMTMADEVPPSLAASLAAYSAMHTLLEALSIEALVAVLSLRLLEGSQVNEEMDGVEEQNDSAKQDSKNKKKGKKKGIGGVQLGKGTVLLRSSLESALSTSMQESESNHDKTIAKINVSQKKVLKLDLENGDRPVLLKSLRSLFSVMVSQLDASGPEFAKHINIINSVLEANAARRKPKVAKGARDFAPDQMAIRDIAFNKIVSVFKRHGAVSIDTPVFELRETLMGKYGEDSKLIYDLADQGGELLSLRYDLTVPFARYVALHGITNIKRYHIAKVYRRDQPQMTRGRFREFYQCDFDIAGSYASMVADAEVVKVLVEILSDLHLGEFEVKLNHRQLLDAMLDIAGVPPQKFRTICSAIDKLDKEPWEVVKAEMTEEKGLPEDVADKIGEFVVLRGQPLQLLEVLMTSDHALAQHPASAAALQDLKQLFSFLKDMNALGPIVFDLSLARGLDYYTGVIYEAVLKEGKVGSIAAGGRYDHLVGMFSGKEVPAVGVSIGIERVFSIMEAIMREEATNAGGIIRETETDCLIASIGSGHQSRRMALASKLWENGVKAEFGYKPNPKMGDQLSYALKAGIPFMVLFGEDEIAQQVVKLKDLDAGSEEIVSNTDLPAILAQKVAAKGIRRIASQMQIKEA